MFLGEGGRRGFLVKRKKGGEVGLEKEGGKCVCVYKDKRGVVCVCVGWCGACGVCVGRGVLVCFFWGGKTGEEGVGWRGGEGAFANANALAQCTSAHWICESREGYTYRLSDTENRVRAACGVV